MIKPELNIELLNEINHYSEVISKMSDTEIFDLAMDLQDAFPSQKIFERLTQSKEEWESKMKNYLFTFFVTSALFKAGYDKETSESFLIMMAKKMENNSSQE